MRYFEQLLYYSKAQFHFQPGLAPPMPHEALFNGNYNNHSHSRVG